MSAVYPFVSCPGGFDLFVPCDSELTSFFDNSITVEFELNDGWNWERTDLIINFLSGDLEIM